MLAVKIQDICRLTLLGDSSTLDLSEWSSDFHNVKASMYSNVNSLIIFQTCFKAIEYRLICKTDLLFGLLQSHTAGNAADVTVHEGPSVSQGHYHGNRGILDTVGEGTNGGHTMIAQPRKYNATTIFVTTTGIVFI